MKKIFLIAILVMFSSPSDASGKHSRERNPNATQPERTLGPKASPEEELKAEIKKLEQKIDTLVEHVKKLEAEHAKKPS